jgi:hypothetical protein
LQIVCTLSFGQGIFKISLFDCLSLAVWSRPVSPADVFAGNKKFKNRTFQKGVKSHRRLKVKKIRLAALKTKSLSGHTQNFRLKTNLKSQKSPCAAFPLNRFVSNQT